MRVSYTWIVTQIVDVLESERGGVEDEEASHVGSTSILR